MITLTSLSHLSVQARLYAAMRKAIKASKDAGMNAPVTLYNKRGKPFMMVWHVRKSSVDGHIPGFYFQDMMCNNVTDTVLQSLKG